MALSEYKITIKYRQGKTNVIADLLSRAFPNNEDFASDAAVVHTFEVETREMRALQEDKETDDEGDVEEYQDMETESMADDIDLQQDRLLDLDSDRQDLDYKRKGMSKEAAVSPSLDLPTKEEFARETKSCPVCNL